MKAKFNYLCTGLCLVLSLAANLSFAQDCSRRGELDVAYCDANGDMVADTPGTTRSPDKLVIGFSSVEDATVLQKTYGAFGDYLKTCLRKEVAFLPPKSGPLLLEALRKGEVAIAQFPVGITMFAVNFAGAIPFAGKGSAATNRPDPYKLLLIVRSDSPYKTPESLKGKRVAHANVASNSGNLAPRALLPDVGLTPDRDYKVEYAGNHENSIVGLSQGMYDGAAVASDALERAVKRGFVKQSQFRVLYESDDFPPDQFSMAHNLEPKLQAQIKKCFYDYKWPKSMSALLEDNDKFAPLDYKANWQIIRLIAKAAGQPHDKAAYSKLIGTAK